MPAQHSADELDRLPLSPAGRRFLERRVFGHFIDGAMVPSASGETLTVLEPSSGRPFATVAAGDAEDVNRAVDAAQRAFDDGRWRNLDAQEKERRLRRLSALLDQNRPTLRDLDMADGGVIRNFTDFFIQFGIDAVDYYAGWPTKLHGSTPAAPPDCVVMEVREPIGVVASITPWNGPSASASGIAAALACGNSVIMKPAEQTPLTALLVAELCLEAGIPPGVVNVVQGVGEKAGAALVEHPGVSAINFTGSVETGRRIQAAAAPRLKRLCMELGGKSPQIVFNDANLDEAATVAAGAVWGHSGQVCTAGTRVLVERGIHDEFVAELVSRSRALKIGTAFSPDTQMGPLISSEQLDRVSAYVAIGKAEGAHVALGGARVGDGGYFHQPTIFTGVDNRMRIAREEIFGPVMAVIPFDTEEEAIAIANDSEFGLSAGVWTRDLSRGHRMTQALRAGTVWVNTYQRVNAAVPYGGFKQSGYGRNLGAVSLDSYTQLKSVWMKIR
ncbi:MAG: aldehyde dehydrogenase family protein [Hydrogenophilaceae bacterium]|nr:aldehyde dehydrogenase family protein [Hydrogenophilaceae bacterium]